MERTQRREVMSALAILLGTKCHADCLTPMSFDAVVASRGVHSSSGDAADSSEVCEWARARAW